MRIFKEEEAQRKRSTPKHGNRMTRGDSKELNKITTLNDVEKEQQRINAMERQSEFKRTCKTNGDDRQLVRQAFSRANLHALSQRYLARFSTFAGLILLQKIHNYGDCCEHCWARIG